MTIELPEWLRTGQPEGEFARQLAEYTGSDQRVTLRRGAYPTGSLFVNATVTRKGEEFYAHCCGMHRITDGYEFA